MSNSIVEHKTSEFQFTHVVKTAGSVACPLCKSAGKQIFEIEGFAIQECSQCKHRFFLPESAANHIDQTYDDTYFDGGGAGYDDYCSEKELLIASGEKYAKIVQRFCPPGRVLDVGSAAGFLLKGFENQGWTGVGVEPNSKMAELGRRRKLEIINDSFEGFCELAGANQQRQTQFDLINMTQVFAHFLDPVNVVESANQLLKPGKFFLVETWDRNSWTARMFSKRWHEYSPPSVVQWFSRKSMDELFSRCGFERVANGKPSKWIKVGHAASIIRYKMGQSISGRLATAPLGIIPKNLRVPYPLDDVFSALYKKK